MAPRRAVSRPRGPRTPALDRLTSDERGNLLGELLVAHPELVDEVEHFALDQLATIDVNQVAESLEWAVREADADQLAYRAGRVRGRGYVEVNEVASEILEELLQPQLDDLSRRAALGLHDAARQLALGLLRGLANCRQDGESLSRVVDEKSHSGCDGPCPFVGVGGLSSRLIAPLL